MQKSNQQKLKAAHFVSKQGQFLIISTLSDTFYSKTDKLESSS